jgi:hypothetical protein
MTNSGRQHTNRARRPAAAAAALLLVLSSCSLDEVEIPDLEGPSTYGLGLQLSASPDIIVADGFSTSLIRATVFDQNGAPASGRDIFFAITDSQGRPADLGKLRSTSGFGVGTGLRIPTGTDGVAQLVYEAPPRTDATAHQEILVTARPVGSDAAGQILRSVRIELRSAEPRLFPQVPGVPVPNCNFVVEPTFGPYRTNQAILFQSTSGIAGGVIIRYEWYFGDGTKEDSPDTAKVYRFPGTYQVTHVVTGNLGGVSACGTTLTVIP